MFKILKIQEQKKIEKLNIFTILQIYLQANKILFDYIVLSKIKDENF
jgi:hypothetical protein